MFTLWLCGPEGWGRGAASGPAGLDESGSLRAGTGCGGGLVALHCGAGDGRSGRAAFADGDGRLDDATCGDRVSSAENALTFTAAGALDIGLTKPTRATSGSEHWPGAIDDVWTFQGALTEDQIWRLAHDYVDSPTEVPSA